jgi:hypothetical protein
MAFGAGKVDSISTDDTKNWPAIRCWPRHDEGQDHETFTKNPLSIVRVTTDSGAEGFGQIAPFDADISATILHRKIAPHVLGKDPYALAAINENCIDRNLKFPWSFVCRALGGVDTALWDLRGKIENKSICELLGGVPRSLGVYGSSMSRSITPEDEAKRLAVSGFARFRRSAIRGTDAGHNSTWSGRTACAAVRKAIGRSCAAGRRQQLLHADSHRGRQDARTEPVEYRGAPVLGIRVDGPGDGGAEARGWGEQTTTRGQRMIALPKMDIAQPDVLCRRDHADAAGGAMAHRAG